MRPQEHEHERSHQSDTADGDERGMKMIHERAGRVCVEYPQHGRAAGHAEADGKLLRDRKQTVARGRVVPVQVGQGDAVHGRKLRGHGHPQHNQGQDEQP